MARMEPFEGSLSLHFKQCAFLTADFALLEIHRRMKVIYGNGWVDISTLKDDQTKTLELGWTTSVSSRWFSKETGRRIDSWETVHNSTRNCLQSLNFISSCGSHYWFTWLQENLCSVGFADDHALKIASNICRITRMKVKFSSPILLLQMKFGKMWFHLFSHHCYRQSLIRLVIVKIKWQIKEYLHLTRIS